MKIIEFKEKINKIGEPIKIGRKLKVNAGNLIGVSTKTLYIREGWLNGTLFLSQRGNGSGGAGDICKLLETKSLEVSSNLYDRILTYAEKAKAIVK